MQLLEKDVLLHLVAGHDLTTQCGFTITTMIFETLNDDTKQGTGIRLVYGAVQCRLRVRRISKLNVEV